MTTRRSILKGLSMGAGGIALAPFVQHLSALDAKEADAQLPKRFVFVVKGSGLQAEFLNPQGLQHGGTELVDESLHDKKLPAGLDVLEPLKNKLTIRSGTKRPHVQLWSQLLLRRVGCLQGDRARATFGGHHRRSLGEPISIRLQSHRIEDG